MLLASVPGIFLAATKHGRPDWFTHYGLQQPDSMALTKQSLTNGKQRVHLVNAALIFGRHR